MSRFPIRAFVGPNGSGKTLAMVEKVAIPMMEQGLPVAANLGLRPEAIDLDPALFIPLESWRQIPDLRGCALLLDEISSVLPARQSQSAPPQLIRILEQMRKQDVVVAWTAPRWEACDVALRRCTQAVTICRGRVPDPWQRDVPVGGRTLPRRLRGDDGKPLPIEHGWKPNRLTLMVTFDAAEFDDHVTNSKSEKLRPQGSERYWRTRHRAMHAYDTLQTVGMLDHLDDVGVCVSCGGHRSRPKCTCDREAPKGAPAPAGAGTTTLHAVPGLR